MRSTTFFGFGGWLLVKINRSDVDIVLFRRSRGNGGQHNNKTATAVRMTHKATGIRVEACRERSQSANIEAAYEAMADRLNALHSDALASKRREHYESKSDATFGSKMRTYSLCERYVVDHRTGHRETNPKAVLDGGIDGLIRSVLMTPFG
jgi:peptide chain release factor 2